MIQAKEAIRVARTFLGETYTDEMQCDDLIVKTIRRSRGGVADYRISGTNWLWESIRNSGKYRHVTWRQEGLGGAMAGMLAFKRDGENIHHVGLVTGEGTVIHASSVLGRVAETPLTEDEGWALLAVHRSIRVEPSASPSATPPPEGGGLDAADAVYIVCAGGGLRMRKTPSVEGEYMKIIPDGTWIAALEERDGWIRCAYRGHTGWVSGDYCRPATGND